ncbi:MAG TPA: helix-turn-helix domain-containing protein [Gemmatimonadales bacterium]|jgi:predicted transcriptional regulator|nr:helix-turn-helix domain-containing protein [Gemmatimonadales bacterium]
MPTSIERFRSEVRQLTHGKAPRAVRYPVRLRATAVVLARARVRQGHAVRAVARELGVAEPTLAHWLRRRPDPALRPVAVEPDVAPVRDTDPTLVVITASGVRVEGLDRDTLIAVLRALA